MAQIIYMKDGEGEGTSRISIDGYVIDSKNFVGICDANIHAIQWNGSKGEVEYNDGTNNKEITDISSYDFENKHSTEKKALEDAEAKEKADLEKAEEDAKAKWTYAEKRKNEYPSITDQLDDLYHNGIDGWKTTIKAVKDKYPKS